MLFHAINLIKIGFSDTLPLVYIIITVLIPKYSGLEGRDGGGAYVLPFFGSVYQIQPFIFNYIDIQGYSSLFCNCCLFYFVILVIVCHKKFTCISPIPFPASCYVTMTLNQLQLSRSYFH